MYVDLLTAALDDAARAEDLDDPTPLFEDVLERRAELLAAEAGDGRAITATLAAQVSYDRALIRLGAALGLQVDVAWFDRPDLERQRLEDALGDLAYRVVPAAGERRLR